MIIRWRRLLLLMMGLGAEGIYHSSVQTILAPEGTPKDSLFGYSIAYQPATKRVIISAPNNDIGKVYNCDMQNKKCQEFTNDIPKDYYLGKMWLGATVASSQNFTMACAPRYMMEKTKTGTFGKCFAAPPNSQNLTALMTLSDKEKGNLIPYELNMDSFGWSIDVAQNGSVVVGGPFMHTGRAITYSSIDAAPKLLSQSKDKKYNMNFGYSVASGHFMSNKKDDIVYAISSPYGMFGGGALIMFDGQGIKGLIHPESHTPKVGAMFGAAMAAANLLRDKPQALLVGAPAFAYNGKGEFDRGAVYVYQYCSEKRKGIVSQKAILGKVDGGRFGSAIVNLGDLNGDGLHEVAVAAPYEDSGAVYIYSAVDLLSSTEEKVLQKIRPSASGIKAFGLSMAAFQDYDDNGCNELAIGAPENNQVMVWSCMAKIILNVLPLEPPPVSKYKRPHISDTNYVYNSCVNITFPNKPTNIEAEIEMKLKITHPTATLTGSKDGKSYSYKIDVRNKTITRPCQEIGITLATSVGYEPMIQYEISASQLNSPAKEKAFIASRVLFSDLSHLDVMEVLWVADCGDSGCRPKFNFIIQTTIPKNYIIGSSGSENVSILATNTGDVAYSAWVRVRVLGVHVLRYPRTCELLPEPDTLKCQPRIPVKTNSQWQSEEIELDMKSLKSSSKEIGFEVTLYPKSDGRDPKDKVVTSEVSKTLYVKLHPDSTPMIVRGLTNLGNTVDISSLELEETGKSMSHIYTVHNIGITDWVNIRCEITIQKKPFIRESTPNIEAAIPAQCSLDTNEKDGRYIYTCIVEELKNHQNFLVMVPIFILPETIDSKNLQSDAPNATIISQLQVTYNEHQTFSSVTTLLKLKEANVPFWIIIVAVLVGILVIGIMIFALYECGFFRRKNKSRLRELRRSVHRQSMRRSQIQRNSAERRSGQPGDTGKDATVETDIEHLLEQTETLEKTGEKNPMKNKVHPGKPLLKTLPEETEECKIKKKEQIIRGLQKNLNTAIPNPRIIKEEKITEHELGL